MEEVDGPTLRYAPHGILDQDIELPKRRKARPDLDLLHIRWAGFQDASERCARDMTRIARQGVRASRTYVPLAI